MTSPNIKETEFSSSDKHSLGNFLYQLSQNVIYQRNTFRNPSGDFSYVHRFFYDIEEFLIEIESFINASTQQEKELEFITDALAENISKINKVIEQAQEDQMKSTYVESLYQSKDKLVDMKINLETALYRYFGRSKVQTGSMMDRISQAKSVTKLSID